LSENVSEVVQRLGGGGGSGGNGDGGHENVVVFGRKAVDGVHEVVRNLGLGAALEYFVS
jgi:hypothetical protein